MNKTLIHSYANVTLKLTEMLTTVETRPKKTAKVNYNANKKLLMSLSFLFLLFSSLNAHNLTVRLHIEKNKTPKLLEAIIYEAYLVNNGTKTEKVFDALWMDNYWKAHWTETKEIVNGKENVSGLFVEFPESGFRKKHEVNLKPGDSLLVHVSRFTPKDLGEYKITLTHEQLIEPPRQDVINAYGDKLNNFTAFKIQSDTLKFNIDLNSKYEEPAKDVEIEALLLKNIFYGNLDDKIRYYSIEDAILRNPNTNKVKVHLYHDRKVLHLLKHLKNVRYLKIVTSSNDTLPCDIRQLRNLEYLHIDATGTPEGNINMDVLEQTDLTNLFRLDLINTNLKSIPNYLKAHKNLQILVLSNASEDYNNFDFNNMKNLDGLFFGNGIVPESIRNASTLSLLNLYSVESIPDNLFTEMNQLKRLIISYKKDASTSLPDLTNCKAETLYVRNLSSRIDSYPKGIETMTNLIEIDWHFETSSTKFPQLSKCENLKIFKFEKNRKFIQIPEELLKATSLEELTLRDVNITEIPEDIDNLKKLKQLRIDGGTYTHLPKSIGNLSGLTYLFLDTKELASLPDEFVKLQNLKSVNIMNCKISDVSVIGELSNLEAIVLVDNQITEIPLNGVKNWVKVGMLRFRNNKISDVPDGLIMLPKLKDLDLAKNPINPSKIEKLRSLRSINVRFGK